MSAADDGSVPKERIRAGRGAEEIEFYKRSNWKMRAASTR